MTTKMTDSHLTELRARCDSIKRRIEKEQTDSERPEDTKQAIIREWRALLKIWEKLLSDYQTESEAMSRGINSIIVDFNEGKISHEEATELLVEELQDGSYQAARFWLQYIRQRGFKIRLEP
jgi:hypothetical protein